MKLTITHLVLSTATFGLMLSVPQNAQAAGLIRNVTATPSALTTGQNGDISLTTNGRGLQGPPLNKPTLTGTHATSNFITTGSPPPANAWRSGTGSTTNPLSSLTIEFAFGRVYNLAGFSFWNLGGSPGISGHGIKDVKIQYKLDGGSWIDLTGAPSSFSPGPTTTTELIAVQQFSFSPVYATNVRFSNMTIHSGVNTGSTARLGFSEIQFTSIPEPSSTLALLALGLAGMGLGLRKRV